MKNKKFYIWCADYATNRGEGILANLYLKKINKYLKLSEVIIEDLYSKKVFSKFRDFEKYKKKKTNINHNFIKKYFYPFVSILKVWKKYFLGYKIIYINFLPLWNFFLFALLPKKILLGPITGSKFTGNVINFNTFLRKYVINYFYYISIFFIKRKYKNILLSTNLLKYYFLKNFSSHSLLFNFQLISFLYKKNKKKFYNNKSKIDFLFYNRNHENKNNSQIIFLLNNLKEKYTVKIVGNKLNGFYNYGIISREKLQKILINTKVVFSTADNIYSFFVLDAITANCFVITNYKNKNKIIFFKKNFIFIDFKKIYKTINNLNYLIKKKTKCKKSNKELKKINKIEIKSNHILKKMIKSL